MRCLVLWTWRDRVLLGFHTPRPFALLSPLMLTTDFSPVASSIRYLRLLVYFHYTTWSFPEFRELLRAVVLYYRVIQVDYVPCTEIASLRRTAVVVLISSVCGLILSRTVLLARLRAVFCFLNRLASSNLSASGDNLARRLLVLGRAISRPCSK
jgi:hypothetical protein